MNRRHLLLGMGTTAAGAGAVFGSGAFTQVQAERDITIGIDEDSNALLQLTPGSEVGSVDTDGNGQLVIDTEQITNGGNQGFSVGSTVLLGETGGSGIPSDPSSATVLSDDAKAAFKLTNNFETVPGDDDDNDEIDIAVNLEDVTVGSNNEPQSDLTFIGTVYDGQGAGTTEAVAGGSQAVFNDVAHESEIYFAILLETASTTDPEDIKGTVRFRAGPNLANEFPTDATVSDDGVVNVTQDTTHTSIQDAVDGAEQGDLIQVGSGTYDSVDINVEGLTLEGPNAGTDGDSGSRGTEATITGGVFVDGNPSDVVIDGLAIERTIGEAEGVVQIGSTSNPGANNLTIRNNVITATSNGPKGLGTILIEQIDGEIQIEDNLLTQTGDGTGSALVRGLVEAVQLENTAIVLDGNTIETDVGVRPSGFDGPSPEYTITNNEFVENDRIGVQLGGDYNGEVEISGNTFEDSNIGIDHATGATTDITIESNTFTETEDADIVAFVSDRRGGDGSVVGLDRDTIESNNSFNPGSTQAGPISFDGEELFDIVPDNSE